jgi:hypothetical protein
LIAGAVRRTTSSIAAREISQDASQCLRKSVAAVAGRLAMAAAVSQVGQAGLDRAEHEMAEATGNAEHEAACFEPVIREARRMLAHLIDRTMRPGRQRWPGGFVSVAARFLLGQSLETPEGEQYPSRPK